LHPSGAAETARPRRDRAGRPFTKRWLRRRPSPRYVGRRSMADGDNQQTGHDEELAQVLEEVRRIEVQSRQLVRSMMSGGYTSAFRGAGIEFDEVREYVEGDDPRLVDWSVTARQGRPYVKKYVDERELTMLFALDVSPSMAGGFGMWSARQTAIRIAACLALAAVRNQDKCGLLLFDHEVRSFVPPTKGRGHALRIIRDALMTHERDGTTGFDAALDYLGRVQRRRAVVFVLSDFLGFDAGQSLTRLAGRHDVVAVRILSPEMWPPEVGLMRVRDPETGRQTIVDWGSEAVREDYGNRVTAWRRRLAADFDRCGVDVMDVPVLRTAERDAIARPVLRFFRMRQQRGMKR
jgi:uncharacterized protein (DUF58 family)